MSNMATNGEFSAGNREFAVGLGFFLLLVLGAWLAFHPNSPMRTFNALYVLFPEVGTLEKGGIVEVSGLRKGKVSSVELVEEGVWVGIKIDRKVKVPKNSRFRVINSGLLGQRNVEIRLGDGQELYADGDSLAGGYDMGSTRLAYVAKQLLQSLDSMLVITLATWDTTLGDPNVQKRIDRLQGRLQSDVKKIKAVTGHWGDSLALLRQEMIELGAQVDSMKETVGPAMEGLGSDLKGLGGDLALLSQKAQKVTQDLDWLSQKLKSDDNSAGALINNGELHIRVKSMVQEIRSLLGEIRKKGLDMNVDVF